MTKVADFCPPATVTLGGTLATDGLALSSQQTEQRVGVKPDVGGPVGALCAELVHDRTRYPGGVGLTSRRRDKTDADGREPDPSRRGFRKAHRLPLAFQRDPGK